MAMVDMVEHRGVKAFQSVYGDLVTIIKPGEHPVHIRTGSFRNADELKELIDRYLDSQ